MPPLTPSKMSNAILLLVIAIVLLTVVALVGSGFEAAFEPVAERRDW